MSLKESLEERDKVFQETTNTIIDSIPDAIKAVTQFIHETEETEADIIWDEIVYFEPNDTIVIVAILSCDPGDVIQLPSGETVEVSENTADYFKRMLRLGFPYSLVSEPAEAIYEYLKQSDAESEDDETVEMLVDPNVVNHLDNTTSAQDFDVELLTDEQQAQLKLFALTSGGGEK